MIHKQRLVIIGNGMAGARLIEEVLARQGGDLFEIVVFGDEPYGNYNRILLSNVLAGSHDPDDIYINPLNWYKENGIKLHAGNRASMIDRWAKLVYGADGVVEPYDKLVIATGSIPFVPPIDNIYDANGRFKTGSFVFRTLDDCEEMIRYANSAGRAAVIGGGLLGLEAARGLLNRGLEVHVVHLTGHPMNVQLDPPAGAVLKETLERLGVHLHLQKSTSAVLGNEHVSGLAFKDESTLDCDMLVVSAGIRANTALAKRAGLSIERGIVVNDDLTCSNDPDIYAIGECAQHRGLVYGLVAPLWEQAQRLADRLTQHNPHALYQGSQVSTKLKVMGVELAVMGEKEPSRESDEVVVYTEPSRGIYKKLIIRRGVLAGAILLGDSVTAPRLLQVFDRKE
ncbi:MAG: NAD(P)/FAD-dependent oxidoreductase, partial [Chloroflexi bacterium]|nr:NAD(P)/FAD-dependent oxidoreductase [Chloroflexota bacterium]